MNIFKDKNFWILIAIIFLLLIFISFLGEQAYYILAGLVLLFLIIFFWFYPQIGIYLIVFLFPFNYWEFVYGSINIPYVDLVALILFIAWFVKFIYLIFTKKQKLVLKNFPGWFFMLLFVMAGALSLMSVDRELFWQSLKYFFRPIIFFYLMFIALPYNIIDSFKKLYNVFNIMFVLGILLSLTGLWSLIFPPFLGIRRAVPISIFGIWPLGTNHNSLAEVFVCLIPIALILFWKEKDIFMKNIYLVGALLMTGINLLTLSRSGWLAILLELFILLVLKYRESAKRFFTSYLFYLILILVAPILYLMYQLATSNIIVTSNLSRFKLIEIALHMFKQHPFFGAGVGTFVPFVNQTTWYIVEYGNALDAHGFIFKTLAETGIFGTLSFLAILAYIIYRLILAYKKYSNTQYAWLIAGLLCLAVGDIVFQLFSTSYYLARFWLPLGLTLTAIKLCDLNLKNLTWQEK
jgi:O-antigen ligase